MHTSGHDAGKPHPGLVTYAQDLLNANRYLTLATTGPDGRPWASPVFFAAAGVQEFYWISEIGADHSRNLVERPHISLVVFDSTVAPYHGRALYATGTARELPDEDVEAGLAVYPGPDDRGVVTTMTREDVTGSSTYRLYCAITPAVWVLCPRDPGQPCSLHGISADHRARVV